MAEQLSPLERELFALGGEIAWPLTPRLVPLRRRRPQVDRRLLIALLAAALAALLAAGAVAAGYLHIPGIEILRSSRPLPTPSKTLPTTPLGERLDLGGSEPSVAAAAADAGFPVRVPAGLGPPDEIFFKATPVPLVTLVYAPRADLPAGTDPEVGALLMEFRSADSTNFLGKTVGPDTHIEQVSVDATQGVWLAGAPHEVFVESTAGSAFPDRVRLAGNTLIWYRAGVTYRLEANVSKERALAIAGTLR
ncbi:MAG TPA: hypothetical protein VF160_01250 [Candidatus Dormibacteraeota bacterium]